MDNFIPILVLLAAIPEDAIDAESEDEDKENPDERISIRASEKRIACDEEFSDSEDEGEGGRRDVRSHRPSKKKHKNEEEAPKKEQPDIKGMLLECSYSLIRPMLILQ